MPDELTPRSDKAERRAARETIGRYHEEQLLLLLERVRDGFRRLDAGEIDAFELDELIHQYKRSARELWKFCGQSGSGWLTATRTLEYWREHAEEPPDWVGSRRISPARLIVRRAILCRVPTRHGLAVGSDDVSADAPPESRTGEDSN